MRLAGLLLLVLTNLSVLSAAAQDSAASHADRLLSFPSKFIDKLNRHSAGMEEKVMARSEKALKRLAKQEERLKKKLAKKDSTAAAQLFNGSQEKYKSLEQQLKEKQKGLTSYSAYIPRLDTLSTSLKFLSQSKGLVAGKTAGIQKSLSSVQSLEGKMQQAEAIQQYIRQRRQVLKDQLGKFGMVKELKQYNEEAYYYAAQVKEYKNILQDPDKLERKALAMVKQLPAFKDFMQHNSMLASLFPMPAGYGTPQALQGLQLRSQVQDMLQARLAAGGPGASQMLQQNIQQAQSQMNQLKDKINKLGGGSSDMEIPDFKPNNQRTKSFLQRLEYGSNLQSQKSNGYFPTTSDIGLSLGYKLNDKSTVGIGASYKIGWGKDISHIRVSSEGMGLRSFLDVKLKGSFYASGGFEYNYQQPFSSVFHLPDMSNWQQSGLVGLSKIVSMKTKVFKKTKVQLLWDFLSYRQRPQGQAVKFRVGYNF